MNDSNDKGGGGGGGLEKYFENFDVNAAKGELDLSKIPGQHVIHPFQLHTSGGSFKFSIFGRIEIISDRQGLMFLSDEDPDLEAPFDWNLTWSTNVRAEKNWLQSEMCDVRQSKCLEKG